jgi:hypothetical protein
VERWVPARPQPHSPHAASRPLLHARPLLHSRGRAKSRSLIQVLRVSMSPGKSPWTRHSPRGMLRATTVACCLLPVAACHALPSPDTPRHSPPSPPALGAQIMREGAGVGAARGSHARHARARQARRDARHARRSCLPRTDAWRLLWEGPLGRKLGTATGQTDQQRSLHVGR